MASSFKPNKRGLDQLQRELQRELNKRPVYVQTNIDPDAVLPPATTVNNYSGPVVTVNGDNAQIAWDAQTVNQMQNNGDQIARGYEALATLVTDLLANLSNFALGDDEPDAREAAETVLGEVVKSEPDQGVIKRGVTMLKGLLAPVAAGVAVATTDESTELARKVIEGLGSNLPF